MGERVTISYRGATYELGRGKRCYGIWAVQSLRSEPVERWPETPEGWVAAWTRFTAVETPGTIAPVGQQHQVPNQGGPAGPDTGAFAQPGGTVAFGRQSAVLGRSGLSTAGSAFAVALLGLGVICGLVGLFLHYQAGTSLINDPSSLVSHAVYLGVWTIAALLIMLRAGAVARAGALLATGTSVITFGLFLADLGEGFSVADAGLWISVVGWLACAVGSVVALRASRPARLANPSWPGTRGVIRAALLIAVAIGAAVTYFPNWDSFLLHASTSGQSEMVGQGYAFASDIPGWVQVGNVAIIVLFVLVVIVAALRRSVAAGAVLLAGAVIPMGVQAVSGMIAATEPTSPTSFGLTTGQAQQVGLTITNGLTPAFWLYSLFMVILLVSCGWMLMAPADRLQASAAPEQAPEQASQADQPAAETGTEPVSGTVPDSTVPVTESFATPVAAPATEPVTAPRADDAWTERELTADSMDDRA